MKQPEGDIMQIKGWIKHFLYNRRGNSLMVRSELSRMNRFTCDF